MEIKKEKLNKPDILNQIKINLETVNKGFSTEKKLKSHEFLTEFQKKKENIDYIPILLQSEEISVVFFGLQILERLIDYNWEILSNLEQNLIHNFIFRTIHDQTAFRFQFNEFSFCCQKLNQCLIKIIIKLNKKDMFSFLKNLIEEAKTSELICEKNLNLISIFFENILIKNNTQLKKIIDKEGQFTQFLKKVEQLCHYVLEKTCFLIKIGQNIIIIALICLESMIKVSPNSYCFDQQLFTFLVLLCSKKITMNHSLNCLIELANHENKTNYQLSMKIFINFLIQFQELLPFTHNIGERYKFFSPENKQLILNIILLILTVFKGKTELIEFEKFFPISFSIVNQLMIKFSCIPSIELYNMCLNWWLQIIEKNLTFNKFSVIYTILERTFFDLRIILICRMAKPEEVLIGENENGQIVKEKVYDTEAFEIYKKSKKIFLFLANISKEVTQEIILDKLAEQLEPVKWNHDVLNSLSWAIGSITDVFNPEIENSKFFFVTVLKDLLYLCELKKTKKNKAFIASNIMFIVGQYPKFLKNHWKFCKTVIEKLIEFMSEPISIPGFKDMACDTFLKIGKSCGEHIAKDFCFEKKNFIRWIFDSYSKLKINLRPRHKKQFLSSIANIVFHIQEKVIKKYFICKISFEINKDLIDFEKRLEVNFYGNSSFLGYKCFFLIKTNIKILNILKICYFDVFECISKNFYFLIELISNKIFNTVKKENFFSSHSTSGAILWNLKKELLEMLIKLIKVSFQKNSSIDFDKHCFYLIDPIFSFYHEQKSKSFIDESILSFANYLLRSVDFLQSLESLRSLFKKIFISTVENLSLSHNNLENSYLKIFEIIQGIIIDQFPCLLKLDSDPNTAEKIFKGTMIFLSAGLEHEEELIREISLETIDNLVKLINDTALERYFFSNYSEIFAHKLINLPLSEFSSKSKKMIIKNILAFIDKLVNFLDFKTFNDTLTFLFRKKTRFFDEIDFSQFLSLFYNCSNENFVKKKLKVYLNLTSCTSSISKSSDKNDCDSLSDFPIF